jgi:hypothetical protein
MFPRVEQERLELGQWYSREQVQRIFEPTAVYTPGAGNWGILGIVSIKGRPGDFVFFVSSGARQGDHAFVEDISDNGVLTWQSQPKQALHYPQIQSLIEHDDSKSSVFLFMRERGSGPYRYLGRLGYLEHDPDRERPVHFRWQLLDWPLEDVLSAGEVEYVSARNSSHGTVERYETPALTRIDRPVPSASSRAGTWLSGHSQPNHVDRDARNAELGRAGELMVLAGEKSRLRREEREDLAELVTHVSVTEGDTAGYDILSFNSDGTARYIEVKSTRGSASTAFFVSPNEVQFSEANSGGYVLLRLCKVDTSSNAAEYYEVAGSLSINFDLRPSEFRATNSGVISP